MATISCFNALSLLALLSINHGMAHMLVFVIHGARGQQAKRTPAMSSGTAGRTHPSMQRIFIATTGASRQHLPRSAPLTANLHHQQKQNTAGACLSMHPASPAWLTASLP